jgi:hypothetical protein
MSGVVGHTENPPMRSVSSAKFTSSTVVLTSKVATHYATHEKYEIFLQNIGHFIHVVVAVYCSCTTKNLKACHINIPAEIIIHTSY